jgi:hypothetical protein
MPSRPSWYLERDAIATFLRGWPLAPGRRWRLLPTSAGRRRVHVGRNGAGVPAASDHPPHPRPVRRRGDHRIPQSRTLPALRPPYTPCRSPHSASGAAATGRSDGSGGTRSPTAAGGGWYSLLAPREGQLGEGRRRLAGHVLPSAHPGYTGLVLQPHSIAVSPSSARLTCTG